ncbi:MAG: hypothetical protein EOO81_02890 [Oxalobacteraceae bacterium]|nr:MAG: hypothetical protein EOO81_02890 [Oxalobacteraceae bacterium]
MGVYETAGVVGKASEAALKLAGINKVDIIDKDKGKVTSVYKGTFPKLYAPDFKSTYASKAVDGSGETKLFNVQQNSVFWLDSPDGGAKRPFIKAQIAKDGKLDDNGAPAEPLDVYVPMANSSSAIASVNSEYSINESKIKAAQTNIDTQLRTQVETTYKVQRQRSSRTRHGF